MGQLLGRAVPKSLAHLFMILISLVMIVPFLWMLSTSFKLQEEVFQYPIQWIPQVFHFENYVEVWTSIPFPLYYFNSLKVSILVTLGQLITCSLAGYAFARLDFPGKNRLFIMYFAAFMIPYQVIMIPQYFVIKKLGLVDSHWALILLEIFSPYGVFLMRQFLSGISKELSEAARIDGCNEFGIFARIIMPLAKPALATLGIFAFSWVWNDFQAPLIYLTSDSLKTLPLGLASLNGEFTSQTQLIMAGTVLSLIPVVTVFLFFQRYFISGITAGSVKG
ncbi:MULTISPECIES: carbohydrate ABC transporter permease [Paenibacillus]|uniref:ABC transporter permease n=1 Tax=Paenibacillus silvae TaxID=1325358 RepID=A0ABQ1Z567_9BACL|nr:MULTISPECIES: carbohydrate ABC transporter permease [Paenibacillus]MCK6078160.1 carbohydrate ABC transporter permease [Paenibacillus silvae]MCK6152502.1 carbohydrate ABC transporter permease [Paenibacillus silvae]MCK6271103.1 carbohydrate ABC transporter permease [Paenibacillus silvae]GGH50759.1 ABC transporter permease [Paenibacillus silvae]